MRFDWRQFCDSRNVEYRESGAGTARGNIYIDCPFCGEAGRGKFHLGLRLDGPQWGCWKDPKAHGSAKHPTKLVQRLLGCSWEQARAIVDDQDWTSSDFAAMRRQLEGLDHREDEIVRLRPYRLPRDVFPLRAGDGKCEPFLRYLEGRGLPRECARLYRMHAARSGEFAWRIVLPYFVHGTCVAATGRHIGRSDLRYYTLPPKVTDTTVYNYDGAVEVDGGDCLVIVEGQFDAIVLDWHCEVLGLQCSAVALAGLGWTTKKRPAVLELARRYRRVLVLLDRGEEHRSMAVVDDLRVARVDARVALCPDHRKDPGEFDQRDTRMLFEK